MKVGRWGAGLLGLALALVIALLVAGGYASKATTAGTISFSPSPSPMPTVPLPKTIGATYQVHDAHSVSATWVQPKIPRRLCGTVCNVALINPVAGAGVWLGVESVGKTNTAPAQCNTFYNIDPNQSGGVGSLVRPGDRVSASIEALGHRAYRLALVNLTTGQRYVTTQSETSVRPTTAVIGVGDPEGTDFSVGLFKPVRFSGCMVDGRPLGSFATARTVLVINGQLAGAVTMLRAAGTSFAVLPWP